MLVVLDKTKLLGFRIGNGLIAESKIGVKLQSSTGAKIGVKPV